VVAWGWRVGLVETGGTVTFTKGHLENLGMKDELIFLIMVMVFQDYACIKT
jgi:hypothetical protein